MPLEQPTPDTDEPALWARWRAQRDDGARALLLERHLPYARVIAALVYRRRGSDEVEFDDYLQLARTGLLEAFDRYDPAAGTQFRTFAARRMRGAVLDGVARLSERQSQLNARRRVLAERVESVSKADNTGTPSAAAAPDLFQYLASVGMGLAVGLMLEGTGMLDSGVQASTGPDPLYAAVELRHTRQHMLALLDRLSAAERTVIRGHYLQGIDFDDIARDMGLTKGRISQIHKKALATLRGLMAEHSGCDRSF